LARFLHLSTIYAYQPGTHLASTYQPGTHRARVAIIMPTYQARTLLVRNYHTTQPGTHRASVAITMPTYQARTLLRRKNRAR